MTSIFLNKYSLGYKISLKGDNSIDWLLCKSKDVEYNLAILSKRFEIGGIPGVRLDYMFIGEENIVKNIFIEYKQYIEERDLLCESDDETSETENINDELDDGLDNGLDDELDEETEKLVEIDKKEKKYEDEEIDDKDVNNLTLLVKHISQIAKSYWCNVCLKDYKNQQKYDAHFSKSKKHKNDKIVLEKKISQLILENNKLKEELKLKNERIEQLENLI